MLNRAGIVFEPSPLRAPITDGTVIGIAFYSLHDLEFLDQFLARRKTNRSQLAALVFDVLDLKEMADFERIIPGIGTVLQTPVIGVWKDGSLMAKGTGAQGRKLLVLETPADFKLSDYKIIQLPNRHEPNQHN
jgi:hypothetical protein